MDFLLFSVLWGKWHTRMFVEYCLPSLLAPGNIPALQARKTTFAIYTDTDGINTIANSTIFKALSSVVDVEFMNLAALAQRDPAYMDKNQLANARLAPGAQTRRRCRQNIYQYCS